jgi:hypothetical protein
MIVTKERWRELCKRAAIEKDPGKLVELCNEISSILQSASNASEQASSSEKPAAANNRTA